ncbi:DUF6482 family protein [Vibrio parahaemolyticus]|uniref:Lysyl-tRNA synthetase n=1 Tax=Vibrio parahaemolyticus TaxID=670 RepID=A0A249W929_VIBPH|nr:DUF6482 family protein [Vibrio parahaemolyticus]EVU19802.1 putative lysyl-tRNA synthetase [Vibrio parahaemolyticus V-223/04]ASZ53126.1 hypothetical protein YA91_22495 [Vibrio parahaemolyticus]AUT88319.1 hypothetical protein RK51_016700 [Vibrio parahaemolyticus]EGF42933.1 hypothetical protein VP10329_02845 [Vibrio parahaemolyticus 10329]EGQ7711774.1 hypothetical protein [Vibrio parahaemolyticus]
MQKHQLDMWLHGQHKDTYTLPKVFVIGCSDVSDYLLAVEYKHQLEPIKDGEEPLHFGSLDLVKEELLRLGFDKAYLRLHNAYDECGSDEGTASYCDIELSLVTH